MKINQCTECKREIEQDKKICDNCKAKAKEKRSMYIKGGLAVVSTVVVGVIKLFSKKLKG